MRVNVHDFSGHIFQVQLSRSLASRGHEVLHGFSEQFVTGRGRLAVCTHDPDTFRVRGLTCERPMVKYSPAGRMRFEASYAKAWQAELNRESFDLVVACNVPLLTLAWMQTYFARRGQPWVLWHQDLYSLGVGAEAARALPRPAGSAARVTAERLERVQVRNASAVVAIAPAMVEQYEAWGIRRASGVHVVPNWAPLDDIRPGDRDNAWSRAHALPDEPLRLLYAGTLGRKHNPLLLLRILDDVQRQGTRVVLTVASEGVGADDLAAAAAGRSDVRFVGFQPAESLSDMLASADAVVALLEPDASRFSVPSKVLTYLSAGRPIVALLPDGNPAARDVIDAEGFVGEPTPDGARDAATWLVETAREPGALKSIGRQARALARKRFDIETITDTFEGIFEAASRSSRRPTGSRARAAARGLPRDQRATG